MKRKNINKKYKPITTIPKQEQAHQTCVGFDLAQWVSNAFQASGKKKIKEYNSRIDEPYKSNIIHPIRQESALITINILYIKQINPDVN